MPFVHLVLCVSSYLMTLLCLGTMVYLSNRSYAGIVHYLPADPQDSSPRDRTRCLSGWDFSYWQAITYRRVDTHFHFSPRIPSLLWLVSSHIPVPALLTATEQLCYIDSYVANQLLGVDYLMINIWYDKYLTWWHSVMSQSHEIKGGSTD